MGARWTVPANAAVIVATYNQPEWLDLCLTGLARQSRTPAEVIVADDGSTSETAELCARWKESGRLPVTHVWHADEGFRKGAICNAAVRASTAPELLFLDSDAIPHRHWIADHMDAARRAEVRCGRRVKLGPEWTPQVTSALIETGALERRFGPVFQQAFKGDTQRAGLGVRLPYALSRALAPRPRKLMGVNFGVSRATFEAVNGYDEDWPAHYREDRDLDLRLGRGGFRYVPLLHRAIVYHLHHGTRPPDPVFEEYVRWDETQGTRSRCRQGLVRDESVPPTAPLEVARSAGAAR